MTSYLENYDVVENTGETDEITSRILVFKPSSGDIEYSLIAGGEEVLSIIDDGNGYKLGKKISKDLDYHDAANLLVLLSFINRDNELFNGHINKIEHVLSI